MAPAQVHASTCITTIDLQRQPCPVCSKHCQDIGRHQHDGIVWMHQAACCMIQACTTMVSPSGRDTHQRTVGHCVLVWTWETLQCSQHGASLVLLLLLPVLQLLLPVLLLPRLLPLLLLLLHAQPLLLQQQPAAGLPVFVSVAVMRLFAPATPPAAAQPPQQFYSRPAMMRCQQQPTMSKSIQHGPTQGLLRQTCEKACLQQHQAATFACPFVPCRRRRCAQLQLSAEACLVHQAPHDHSRALGPQSQMLKTICA